MDENLVPPAAPIPPPLPKKSNYKPILLTMLFAFLLGGGSCFGFLSTLNMNSSSPLNTVFALGFFACVFVFIGAIVWLIVRAIRQGRNSAGGNR